MKIVLMTLGLLASVSSHAGVEDRTLHDQARNRDIPIRIYHPTSGPGPFPVIIFSHGAGGSREGYGYFGEFMAAHGFVSIHPTHAGSDHSIITSGRPLKILAAIKDAVNDPKQWQARVDDVRFVLDSIGKIAPEADRDRIAMAGHSYGAMTTMMLAGAVVSFPGKSRALSEPRLKAFIAVSPQGTGPQFAEHAWDHVTAPVLLATGSRDTGIGGQPVAWRLSVFDALPPGKRYLVYVEGATHMSFSDRSEGKGFFGDPGERDAAHAAVTAASLAFLKLYLLGDESARAALTKLAPVSSKGR